MLQRKCACGKEGSGPTGECDECRERRRLLQTKLTVGSPHDAYEEEADRVAELVTGTSGAAVALASAPPHISRTCTACEAQTEERRPSWPSARDGGRDAPALVTEVLGSPGHALDASSRAYFEPRFGRDLAGVRIHSDARAAASARSVNALAYTSGQHIAFAAGAYAPTSAAGRRLLAHELTHTVQQSSAPLLATAGAGVVQRQPQRWEPRLSSGPGSQFFTTPRSNDTEAYFGRATDVCRTCHQPSEEGHFQVHKVQHAQVTESKIREWAATEAWGEAIISGRSLTRKQLFSLLLRREDKKLDTVWESYREPTVAKVRPVCTRTWRARSSRGPTRRVTTGPTTWRRAGRPSSPISTRGRSVG